MDSESRSGDQLFEEVQLLRRRVAELEGREVDHARLGSEADVFRRLVEHSLGLMCIHDLEGNLLFVNSAAAQTLGFRPEDGVGRNLRRFLAPAVAGQFDNYLERIRANRADSGCMRVVANDGRERIWLYRNVLYEDPGKPPRVLGHAQDVTDRIRAEQALKESEQRFRLLADTAPVLIWMSDPSGRCVLVNQAWLDFTGRRLEEQLGEGWIESIHPDDRDGFIEGYRSAVAAQAPFQAEYRLRRADGEYRWALGSGVPRNDTETFAGLIGSCVDVTEIRRAREVLEQARDELTTLVARRTSELELSEERLGAEMRQRAQLEQQMTRMPARAGEGLAGTEAILLVEDDEHVRQLLRDILNLHGYRVVDVSDPVEALALLERRAVPVDLLLTDVAMPRMSGPALAGQASMVKPGVKTLYMSGYASEALEQEWSFGADVALLRKPFTVTSLLGKVREVLDG
jgi:PAS domain S-box-containing protein